jgi:protoheme IX farnesyltransferase
MNLIGKAHLHVDNLKIMNEDMESSVLDYVALMKPRVMSLVVFSSIAGIFMAPGHIGIFESMIIVLCISMASGASAAINMWYDRDIDAIMTRTKNRPIVTGKIEADEALAFGIVLSFFSVFILAICVNLLSAFLTFLAIIIYVFIYTIWLKRTSIHNIVIGGASGAIPPMIGYAGAGGGIDLASFSMFLIIFLWTPPHFWSLAILRQSEYKKCNVPMLPVIKGDHYTKIQIIIYIILTMISSFIPYFLGIVGNLYFIVSILLGLYFLYISFKLLGNKCKPYFVFSYSIIYLFAIFTFMMIDKSI